MTKYILGEKQLNFIFKIMGKGDKQRRWNALEINVENNIHTKLMRAKGKFVVYKNVIITLTNERGLGIHFGHKSLLLLI